MHDRPHAASAAGHGQAPQSTDRRFLLAAAPQLHAASPRCIRALWSNPLDCRTGVAAKASSAFRSESTATLTLYPVPRGRARPSLPLARRLVVRRSRIAVMTSSPPKIVRTTEAAAKFLWPWHPRRHSRLPKRASAASTAFQGYHVSRYLGSCLGPRKSGEWKVCSGALWSPPDVPLRARR